MARLAPPFILCPFSDRNGFVGISEEGTPNKAILTLSKNIAIRYHVFEQKQEISWTSTKHWFTSKVINCVELGYYGAVMDYKSIGLWEEENTSLRKMIKFKFNQKLHELKYAGSMGTLVIFSNGSVGILNDYIQEHPKLVSGPDNCNLQDDSEILECFFNDKKNTVYIVSSKKSVPNNPESLKKSLMVSVLTKTEGAFKLKSQIDFPKANGILGQTVCTGSRDALIYLDNLGYLYRLTLEASNEPKLPKSQPSKLGNLGKMVHLGSKCILKPLSDDVSASTILVYACDSNQEGSVLFIYNYFYDLIVSKQALKLFGSPPIMETARGICIVPVGLHFLAIPFHTGKSILSEVIAKHEAKCDEEVIENRNPWIQNLEDWEGDDSSPLSTSEPIGEPKLRKEHPGYSVVVHHALLMFQEGHSESVICNIVTPRLLELKNMSAIHWLLKEFPNMEEFHLVSIVKFLLESGTLSSDKEINENSNDVETGEIFVPDPIISQVLERPVSSSKLRQSLSTVRFDYNSVLMLLSYFQKCLQNLPINITEGVEVTNVVVWMNALLDVHYSNFILNNEVEVVSTLLQILADKLECLSCIEDIETSVHMIKNKLNYGSKDNSKRKWRTEMITFVS